jgi:transcriptional regulator with XRE-family HTH domain
MATKEPWGKIIKRLRLAQNLTQAQLADRVALDRGHLARIETGSYKDVRRATYEKLARGLGMTAAELDNALHGERVAPKETAEDLLRRLTVAIDYQVPVYSDYPLHAGYGVEPVDFLPIARSRVGNIEASRLQAFPVHGTCLEPVIHDGDIVIVDREGQIDAGSIIACLVGGELHLGRLREIRGQQYLENNTGRFKFADCQAAARVIRVEREL